MYIFMHVYGEDNKLWKRWFTLLLLSCVESMSDENVIKLRQNRAIIVKDLHIQDILDFLMGEAVITAQMKEEIMAKPTRQEKAGAFLDRLETRGERAFYVFKQALKSDYIYLHDQLHSTKIGVYSYFISTLVMLFCDYIAF